MELKHIPSKTLSSLPRLFSQSTKYIRFQRYHGVNIREQSQRNYQALLKRLDQRTHVPEVEHQHYGAERLSPNEANFFRFWYRHIMPLFTARHGTEHFAYIQHTGHLMPVADRRRADAVHQNSRTRGFARQDYTYCVLGIGARHPVPVSVANSKTITLHFNRMTPEEKQQFAGMFIGGHSSDYMRDITYPIVVCGDTQYKVNYNKTTRLRTSTFKRADGTIITETLTFEDEIIAADPSIDVIFEWLGYKMIEYLRFIGGQFQTDILTCNNIDKIATIFHALFPSYRFPELKIPLSKIPVNAHYVEVNLTNEISQKAAGDFHLACQNQDLRAVKASINPTIANVPYEDDDVSPLTAVLKAYRGGPHALAIVQLLLENNADVNSESFLNSNLSRAINSGDQDLQMLLMRGSVNPHCPTLRTLPKVGYIELKAVIQSHQFALFEVFYPHYLEYANPQTLFAIACNSTCEKIDQSKDVKQQERFQANYEGSLRILERLLVDCNPNCDDEEEKAFCIAARGGKLRVVRALLKHPELNINQTKHSKTHAMSDQEGWTALHFACWKGQLEIVKELLEANIDVNAIAYNGQTALDLAENVLSGNIDFMSKEERHSEQLTNKNLTLLFKHGIPNRALSTQDSDNFRPIIAALEAKGAKKNVIAETQPRPQQTNFAVVACITATVQNRKYVLLVRKGDNFDQARGYYLFPGGFYDQHRDRGDFTAAAIRETREETSIDISQATCSTLAIYETEIARVQIKRHFFHFDLGDVDRLPYCNPNSDIAEALWVNTQDIDRSLIHDELAMSFRSIPLCHSNALILEALVSQTLPDPQCIMASEDVTHEKCPDKIASSLYLVFHLQSAYSVRHQLIDTFLTLRTQIPEGYLLDCYDELLQALKEDDAEDTAKACIQNFITHLVRTGRCNIDDLRHKNIPLLHLACTSNLPSTITWVLDQGANVNSTFQIMLSTYTPLNYCISLNLLDSARLLIERYGASINLGETTDSALTVACSLPMIPDDFIEYLLDKLGVINDEELGTILHELVRTQRLMLLGKVLTQYPIDLNRQYIRRQDLPTKTYLMLTAINVYNLECVKMLVNHGADPMLQHRTSSNLIDFAEYMKRDLKSKQQSTIAKMPSHPRHKEEARFFSFINSFNQDEAVSEEDLQRQLTLIEKNIVQIDEIIGFLKSYLPAKDPEPKTYEEYVMQMLSRK